MIEVVGNIEKEERFEEACGNCGKQLRFGKDDVQTGAFGCAFLVCPVCGEEIDLMDEKFEKSITPDNVVYPDDFFINRGVHIKDDDIEADIRKYAKRFMNDKSSDYMYVSTGDFGLLLLRDGDENDIIVEVVRPIASTSMRDCG